MTETSESAPADRTPDVLSAFCRELLWRLYGRDNPSVVACLSGLDKMIEEKYNGSKS